MAKKPKKNSTTPETNMTPETPAAETETVTSNDVGSTPADVESADNTPPSATPEEKKAAETAKLDFGVLGSYRAGTIKADYARLISEGKHTFDEIVSKMTELHPNAGTVLGARDRHALKLRELLTSKETAMGGNVGVSSDNRLGPVGGEFEAKKLPNRVSDKARENAAKRLAEKETREKVKKEQKEKRVLEKAEKKKKADEAKAEKKAAAEKAKAEKAAAEAAKAGTPASTEGAATEPVPEAASAAE